MQRDTYATGTAANVKSHWRTYLAFCLYFDLQPVPASSRVMVLFLQFLSRSVNSVKYIQNVISSVRQMHLWAGAKFVASDSPLFTNQVSGLKRQLGTFVAQKLPITPDMLKLLFAKLQERNSLHLCLWAAFTIAFFSFLRKSNLFIKSQKGDTGHALLRSQVTVTPQLLLLQVSSSKTIQHQQRSILIPLASLPHSILCPVKAYRRLMQAVPLSSNAPAFGYHDSSGRLRFLTCSVVETEFKQLLKQAGFNPLLYSIHSFRRGGCSFAFEAGVDVHLIKSQGDWSSDAYQRYLKLNASDRLITTVKMGRALTF
jgi:hypothetical protein